MESTEAMELGSLLDHKMLGTVFPHVLKAYDNYRTKEAQQWREEMKATGTPIFEQDHFDTVASMEKSLRTNPTIARVFKKGRTQVGVICDYETQSGETIGLKSLIDWVPDISITIDSEGEKLPLLIDLKKTRDASPHGFRRQLGQIRYDVQAAYYLDAWEAVTGERRHWAWACVEDKEPYAAAFYILSRKSREVASATWKRWVEDYIRCSDDNTWPSYNKDLPALIESPLWILNGKEEE